MECLLLKRCALQMACYYDNNCFFVQKQASPQKSCKKIKISVFVSTYGNLLCKFTPE